MGESYMVFVASFAIFIVFVGGLALGLLRNRPLKSEDEAKAAIMDGIPCASCQSSCGFAGGKVNHSSSSCMSSRMGKIPHKEV